MNLILLVLLESSLEEDIDNALFCLDSYWLLTSDVMLNMVGQHASKQVVLLYFVAIVRGFTHVEFRAAVLCLSTLLFKLTLIEELDVIHLFSID